MDYYYRKEKERVGGDYRAKGEEFRIDLVRIGTIAPFTMYVLIYLPVTFPKALITQTLRRIRHSPRMVPRSQSPSRRYPGDELSRRSINGYDQHGYVSSPLL